MRIKIENLKMEMEVQGLADSEADGNEMMGVLNPQAEYERIFNIPASAVE